ncbi:MAG TPA: hypothetical protein VM537_06470, partial [Anaerolineae bacterium]|nr:hypothetical protein [Anaerolineae bacterium]
RVVYSDTVSARAVEVSCDFSTDLVVYLATAGQTGDPPYLQRSDDGGDTWHPADSGLDRTINALAIGCDPGSSRLSNAGSTLFAGSTALFRSSDGGNSWQPLPGWPAGVSIEELAVSPQYATDSTVLAGTFRGVYRSTDSGVSWTLSQGFVPLDTQVVVPSPAYDHDGTLFAGTEMGVHKSTDRGLHWQPANKGLVGSFATTIADVVVSPAFASDTTLFASWKLSGRLGGSVYRSTDGGDNWQELWSTEYVGDLAISADFTSDQTLFATGTGGMVFRSTDGGLTFTPKLDELDFDSFEIAISPQYGTDQTVYAAGYGPLYRSSDGGETWQPLPGAWPPHYGVAVSPVFGADDTLFASYREIEGSGLRPESGVIRSVDRGATWDLATAGLPGTYEPWPQSLALSPGFASNRKLFTAVSGTPHLGPNQVYASGSSGDGWSALPPISQEPLLHKLSTSLEPNGSDTLHAGSSAGAYHYSATCYNGIANGGFEFSTGWTMPVTPKIAAYSPDLSHGGHRSLRTGILPGEANVLSYSSAYQTVSIPEGVTNATLRFWAYSRSGEPRPIMMSASAYPLDRTTALDAQYLWVLDSDGQWLRSLLLQASDDRLWTFHEFDLADFAGQTIRLHASTYNDGVDGVTAMYVDDVSLEICPEPEPPPGLDHFLYLPLLTKRFEPPSATPTATATLTPTPTPTATPIPPCAEMVLNGDFEVNGGWTMPYTPMRAGYSTDFALSGVRSMRTGIAQGGSDIYSYSAASQSITLPPGPGSATLSMWTYLVSSETGASASASPAQGGYSILESRFPGLRLPSDAARTAAAFPAAGDRQYVLLRDQGGAWHLLLWTLADTRTWQNLELDLSAYLGQTVLLHFETYNDGEDGVTAMYVDDASIQVCQEGLPTSTPTPTLVPPPPEDGLVLNGQWIRNVVGHREGATLYGYSDLDLFRSDDAGSSWLRVGDSVGEFLMSPADPDVLYLGRGYPCLSDGPDIPMVKSTDGGAGWTELPAGLNLKPLAAHHTDPDRVYAGGCDGPYLTTDGGTTWTLQPSPLWGVLEVKHIAPVGPTWETVYAAGVSEGGGGAILKSTDSGSTWQQVTPLSPSPEIWWITDLLVDPADPLTVRFTDQHTPWWSSDGGATWSWSWTGLQDVVYNPSGPPGQTYGIYDLELDTADHDQLYLGTIRGLYVSADGGSNWYKVTGSHTWQDAALGKLLLLDAAPETLYLVREGEQGVHLYDLPSLPPIPT